ncbi:hypothetical protein Droror1_Dr00016910 [Drosera rotundifolia]
MAKTGVSVKLLVDKQSNRVLFAEGGKDFVDFLFHFFSLPLGAVVRLLTKEAMVGSLGNLFASFENLDDDYMQPQLQKDILLKPCPTSSCLGESSLLHIAAAPASSSASTKFYRCANTNLRCNSVSDGWGAICRQCNYQMSREMTYVSPPGETEVVAPINTGYVQGLVMYRIMDDLVVKPMSTISSITLLNKFNVKDVTTLDEKIVHLYLGLDEGLALLKASLETKNVLTNVFLEKEIT